MARLRARISWLKDGDANTKLFHLHARHRKRKNFVARLVDEDQILTSHGEKAACVDQFYTNLLGNSMDRERVIFFLEKRRRVAHLYIKKGTGD
jgi:hypothetical protein